MDRSHLRQFGPHRIEWSGPLLTQPRRDPLRRRVARPFPGPAPSPYPRPSSGGRKPGKRHRPDRAAAEVGPAAAEDEAALRELIPLDFNASSCTATGRPAGDGSLAALTAFQAYVEDRSLNELPSSDAAGCGADQGFGDYSQGGQVVGKLACFIDTEDTAYLVWTNTELNVFAITSRASGDAAELRTLYEWWVSRGQIIHR